MNETMTAETVDVAGDNGQAESVAAMTERHAAELERALQRERRQAAELRRAALDSVRDDAAEAVNAAMEQAFAAVRRQRADGSLRAVEVQGEPQHARELDRVAETLGPGEQAAIVLIPRRSITSGQRRRAWVLIDVSDAVWA